LPLAAVKAGARQVECTINGIGERAGNAALEEVVVAMHTRQDKLPFETKIHLEKLFGASQTLTQFISFGPQPNKAIVGENAFAHEAGIHQDGYLKNPATYEIISPASVGVPAGRLVLGKHSGRHALKSRAADLGYQLSKPELDELYDRFTRLADNKKGVRNEEIAALIEEVLAVSTRAAVSL
jgi:2-isopropylmalate synthase